MKPSSSSLSSTLRPTEPVATRELRTTGTPLLATRDAACTDAAFMLPLPTPAITMPFAPRSAAEVIASAGMSA